MTNFRPANIWVLIILFAGAVHSFAQTPQKIGPLTIKLPADSEVTSALTVTNPCSVDSKLKLEVKGIAFLKLPIEPVLVPAASSLSVFVFFDTRGIVQGVYEGMISTVCIACNDAQCSMTEPRKMIITVVDKVSFSGPPTRAPEFDPKATNTSQSFPFGRGPSKVIAELNTFLKGSCPERGRECDERLQKARELEDKAAAAKADLAKLRAITSTKQSELKAAEGKAAVTERDFQAAFVEFRKCLETIRKDCEKPKRN